MRATAARLFAFIMLLSVACAPAAPTTPTGGVAPAEQRDEQQILRVAVGVMIGNPTPQASRANLFQYWPLYDNLTTFGPKYEVRPWVAERWSVSPDGLTWTFTIRSDMKFANGDPLTSEDVVFSIQEILDRRWPQTSYLLNVTSVTNPTPTTVELKLSAPNAAIPNGGPFIWILPKKYYQSIGFEAFVQKPMGSGPYELVSFQQANQIIYRKRAEPHAFRKPIANEIHFRLIPEAVQVINGLTQGELDMAMFSFSGDQANQLKQRGIVVTAQLNSSAQIAMPQGSWELRDTPLKEKRVRLALNYAVNKEAIASGLYGGYAQPTGQVAVPDTDYFDPTVQPIPYDVAMARRLLAEAGYPNGFRLPGGLDYSTGRGEQNMLVAIQADLRAVGVEVELIPNEESVFVDKAYGRRDLPKGDLWSGSNGEDNGFFTGLRTFYGCDKPVGAPRRAMLYCNPEWDRLMDLAYAEADVAKRRQLFLQANRVFREDVPVIYTVSRSQFVVFTPKVKGVELPTPNVYNLDTVYKIK
ncbi:MAG: ABC transporter substrate-binding protein [Chloroflexota bacterium]|nr:ABC transporter substrate-binding protein [Dehalococcoidia bacterium]MDW8253704.1 ABC transporter substrate-binding protein [Chloroflexota bacterium]